MNKYTRPHRFNPTGTAVRSLIASLLVLSSACVVAQGLKTTPQLRLGSPIGTSTGTAAAGGGAAVQRQADFIVAVVNSEPITNNELRTRVFRAEQQLSQQGTPMPPRDELIKQVLDRMITDKAQLQLARESGIRVDENAVDSAMGVVAQQNQISVEELRRRLAADGIAYAQFRSDLRDEVLVTRLRQREVELRVNITERDIDQFLRDQGNGNDVAQQEINLAQVLVAVPENASAQQVAALQAKAQGIADRARSGADFAGLVSEFSNAPDRSPGGEMGLRSADRYPQLFVEATQSKRSGDVVGPLRSGAGFHVLKVIDKKQGGMPAVAITQTRARHILLRVTPQLTEAAARAKLEAMKKRIDSGQADFATVARENSEDASAKEGGDLGWTNPGMFVPEFEQAMNKLQPGQISQPVTSRFGVHLIQVNERRESKLSTREQRDIARASLRDKKMDEAYRVWAQEVRGRAYVDYRDPPQL